MGNNIGLRGGQVNIMRTLHLLELDYFDRFLSILLWGSTMVWMPGTEGFIMEGLKLPPPPPHKIMRYISSLLFPFRKSNTKLSTKQRLPVQYQTLNAHKKLL